jgi:predicted aspartyl protease
MRLDYPLIEIAIRIGSQSFLGEALPDTGYDGSVIVPVSVAEEITVNPETRVIGMPDGFSVTVNSWEGELMLEDRNFDVSVSGFGNLFIVGREVLDQLEICFEFGRTVRLRFDAAVS